MLTTPHHPHHIRHHMQLVFHHRLDPPCLYSLQPHRNAVDIALNSQPQYPVGQIAIILVLRGVKTPLQVLLRPGMRGCQERVLKSLEVADEIFDGVVHDPRRPAFIIQALAVPTSLFPLPP